MIYHIFLVTNFLFTGIPYLASGRMQGAGLECNHRTHQYAAYCSRFSSSPGLNETEDPNYLNPHSIERFWTLSRVRNVEKQTLLMFYSTGFVSATSVTPHTDLGDGSCSSKTTIEV